MYYRLELKQVEIMQPLSHLWSTECNSPFWILELESHALDYQILTLN